MGDTANNDGTSTETDQPASESNEEKFPPFPEPTDQDFEDDVPEDERNYFKTKFPDLNAVKYMRLHCTACDRHLGSSARNINRMRAHPMLRTLVCHTCHTFYNSGEFEKGDDGSELYCRWCGQGGQVYCCSDCPHVFCAKCIKRNMGPSKIKEIENADDWKCFKCRPESLKDIRAVCWALLRYCDLKNEMTYKTEDLKMREIFQKECGQDYTECCKSRNRKREKPEVQKKKEEKKDVEKPTTTTIISKIPSTIQVKKFASINIDDQNIVTTPKVEKKPVKRSGSPKQKAVLIKNPPVMAASPRLLNPVVYPPPMKKIKMTNNIINANVRFVNDSRFTSSITRIRPRTYAPSVSTAQVINNFNGFNNTRVFSNVQNMVVNDNINLSLESLTQGLDMATVAAMSTQSNNAQNDDVVCTPDFPMEPLCEVTEDNDDDVQCITPDPVSLFKISNPPPLVPRGNTLPELTSDNIIQMTENDVTVNLSTGGLKFRVDPQTLSSNKMYRLPDGRVFAINANPNMPGGYSATIVAITEPAGKAIGPQGATYAAKLSAVPNPNASTPLEQKSHSETRTSLRTKRIGNPTAKRKLSQRSSVSRECDLNVPVEWFRYNLIDAVDALEFSLSRLNKLKKEATTMFLRTRSLGEMKNFHKTLDRLLNTSSKRFQEIKDSLNKEMKQYVARKMGGKVSEDDDDDVEILPDLENEDPIFIDENSVDSNTVVEHENQEIDLTEMNSSEVNDSGEKEATISRIESNPLSNSDRQDEPDPVSNETATNINETDETLKEERREPTSPDKQNNEDAKTISSSNDLICNESLLDNQDVDNMNRVVEDKKVKENDCENRSNENERDHDESGNIEDAVMSDELIENLLKDDSDVDNVNKVNSPDITELEET